MCFCSNGTPLYQELACYGISQWIIRELIYTLTQYYVIYQTMDIINGKEEPKYVRVVNGSLPY